MVSRREPAINVPAPLLVWIAFLAAIHAVRTLVLSDETDLRLLLEGAFLPAHWSLATGWASAEQVIGAAAAGATGQVGEAHLALARYVASVPLPPWSVLSYSLLHGSWMHLGLNCLWLLAFGALVVRRAGTLRCAILWVATAIGGAFAQWLADPLGLDIMVGASASISGFMAAAATFMYRSTGPGRWDFLADRNVLVFLGIWLAANLVFGVIAGPMGLSDGDVAWRAHVGGLLVALVLFPLIDPFKTGRHRSA